MQQFFHIHVLAEHPYVFLFLALLLERMGLPLIVTPLLIAVGAWAALGSMNFSAALAVSLLGTMVGDQALYELGARRGTAILRFLCRISMEPDACVRRSQESLGKNALRTLLVAKFIPGVAHVAPAVAGSTRFGRTKFLLWNTAGTFVWMVAMMLIGYLPVRPMSQMDVARSIGIWALGLLMAGTLFNIVMKWHRKQVFVREISRSRISPEELAERIAAGEDFHIVDLRHPLEFVVDPRVLPGAIRIAPDELNEKKQWLTPDREVVLYCT